MTKGAEVVVGAVGVVGTVVVVVVVDIAGNINVEYHQLQSLT